MSEVKDHNFYDWPRVKALGVYAEVDQLQYVSRASFGIKMAEMALSQSKEIIPSEGTIKGLHFIAFGKIHPWAGEFRRPGQEVAAEGLEFSKSKDVAGDMAALRAEMLKNPLKGTKEYMAEVLGFYHAAALTVHPFADGNGRVFRTILDHQAKTLLGHTVTHNLSRQEYIEALQQAQLHGYLKPLAKVIQRGSHNHWLGVHPATLKLPVNEASRSYALDRAERERELDRPSGGRKR
jgi:fido (protein-threonine AMPylation protein)